ncbi:MAG: ceramidase domain-containing protein [Planctomycetota bacterium]
MRVTVSPSRLWPIGVLLGITVMALWIVGPIEQSAEYHDFADQRPLGSLPHAQNVLSNLPFLLVGVFGFLTLARRRRDASTLDDAPIAAALFMGIFLTGSGSAYYHGSPAHATLVWDRLPMTITFMATVALVLQDHFGDRTGRRALLPLLAIGLSSALIWAGTGDLRLYALVQFFPLVAIPLLWWRVPRLTAGLEPLIAALVLYGLAKGLESLDDPIYRASGHWVSGHALKHLVAAWASFELLRYWRDRRRLGISGST